MKEFVMMNFDGVIIDSVQVRKERIYSLLEKVGLDPSSEPDFESYMLENWGMENDNLFLMLCAYLGGGHQQYYQMLEVEKNFVSNYSPDFAIVSALGKIKSDVKLGVISSRPTVRFYHLLKVMGIDASLFDFIQTANGSGQLKKTSSEIFSSSLAWAEELCIPRDKVHYLGNTVRHDLIPATQAGINFIGVCSGAATQEDFMNNGLNSSRIVPSFQNLPDYLETHFKR